jgi:hypothetical protein
MWIMYPRTSCAALPRMFFDAMMTMPDGIINMAHVFVCPTVMCEKRAMETSIGNIPRFGSMIQIHIIQIHRSPPGLRQYFNSDCAVFRLIFGEGSGSHYLGERASRSFSDQNDFREREDRVLAGGEAVGNAWSACMCMCFLAQATQR